MRLADATWKEVDAFSREAVVVIPTGSLEQHGPHLPLLTDTILATATAEAMESKLPDSVILAPTLWLGASAHHLAFPGSLSASFEGYLSSIESVVESLWRHGFRKFYLVNGHGGNTEPNGIAMRKLKEAHPTGIFGHSGYFAFIEQTVLDSMAGHVKGIRHACEAETSLMMHVRPELVRQDKIRDDGLTSEPAIKGLVSVFDEITEEGSHGYATLANKELGKRLFESAVEGLVKEISAIANGFVFTHAKQ